MTDLQVAGAVELGVAVAPRDGELVSGDAAIAEQLAAGTLVAVVDGTGHGPRAARAAAAAAAAIRASRSEDLVTIMAACHEALRGTRGAAVTLALVGPELAWLGVGSVEGRVAGAAGAAPGARDSLLLHSGTVGHDLPALNPSGVPLEHGDLVVLATDGVGRAFADALDPHGSAQDVAARILATHRRPTDDALVAVARYVERLA